jgi:hypothetical protein
MIAGEHVPLLTALWRRLALKELNEVGKLEDKD